MPRVIARIVIDTDDWENTTSPQGPHPVVIWRKVQTSHAQPFSAGELSQASVLGELYFG